jgi:hypothetical protein
MKRTVLALIAGATGSGLLAYTAGDTCIFRAM